jgi:hypothetical protein
MNLKVRFDFNRLELKSHFIIMNPPVLPTYGELIYFNWPDFITDEKELALLSEMTGEYEFVAQEVCKQYRKDEVEISIRLYRSDDWLRNKLSIDT